MTYQKPLNPVEVENQILSLANQIAEAVQVVSDAESRFMAARRALDQAWAHAYLEAEGAVKAREAITTITTARLIEAKDIAEGAYRHARRHAEALRLQLDAVRSIGVSVRNMYQVAGRGEY